MHIKVPSCQDWRLCNPHKGDYRIAQMVSVHGKIVILWSLTSTTSHKISSIILKSIASSANISQNWCCSTQNGCHFPDIMFKCIFLNENVWISIKISLMCVSKGPINNIPALVQIMALHRPDNQWWALSLNDVKNSAEIMLKIIVIFVAADGLAPAVKSLI